MLEIRERQWAKGMVLEPLAASTEEPLFTFPHRNEPIQVNKKIYGRFEHLNDTDYVLFTIKGADESLLGYIEGFWIHQDGRALFEANTSRNSQRPDGYTEQEVPIPRVVGATIAQIVKRDIVDVWYSSDVLTPDGARMYEHFLGQDPALQVRQQRGSYVVTKVQ